MSTGPIEFEPSMVDDMGPTEYGGEPGLVAGQLTGKRTDASIAHLDHLTTVERRGILVRSKSTATDAVVVDEDGASTITRAVHMEGVDPATGLSLVNVGSEEVTSDSVSPVQ
jgi:hypothetical protein